MGNAVRAGVYPRSHDERRALGISRARSQQFINDLFQMKLVIPVSIEKEQPCIWCG